MFSVRDSLVREKRLGPKIFVTNSGSKRNARTVTEEGALFLAHRLHSSEKPKSFWRQIFGGRSTGL